EHIFKCANSKPIIRDVLTGIMPHIKHPVLNPAHGCAEKPLVISFELCSKLVLQTEHEVPFAYKLDVEASGAM
ncbi:hypothetical protein, partial [Treponema sp. OMZ 840]|uniref:hypothetical protein n=1 Tax=Treponema sp. OMZ 840 TaxID=244313 RepID=UPI003D8B8F85